MKRHLGLTAARVKEIHRRQIPFKYGAEYLPSIRADAPESPSRSGAATRYATKLGRDVHLCSGPELSTAPLALMNPATFELHEQHMAPPFESKNRLKDHPKGRDLFLPVTEGTVAIAAHLGVLSKHPCVDDPDCRDAAGEIGRLAAPYIGDLLLFLEDSEGPYCVDWDVKAMQGDHGRPGAGDWTERTSPKRIRAATCREEIYQECSRQLGIRVVRVAKEDLPRQLRYNLDSLFRLHHQTIDLSADRQDELVAQFQEALISECPPQTVIERYRSLGTPGMKDCKRVLEQAIWNRRIRIDLYSPWGIDWPLLPEVRDPLVEFSHWFSR